MKKTPNEDDHRLIFFMGEISLDEVFTPAVVLSAMLYFHHRKFEIVSILLHLPLVALLYQTLLKPCT